MTLAIFTYFHPFLAIFQPCSPILQHARGFYVCFSEWQAARRVVLGLLRTWTSNSKVLKSLSPLLVGKAWASLRLKLRRDAGLALERDVGKVKMEA